MRAIALVFPRPKTVRPGGASLRLPGEWNLTGERLAPWLHRRLAAACRAAGVALKPGAKCRLELSIDPQGFARVKDPDLRAQSYRLTLRADGSAGVESPSVDGLRHGVITLALALEAAGSGAKLTPMVVEDVPAFRVRGIQIDTAREFFPPSAFLRKMVDRMADLKLNTLWLYLENRFHAPGLEDLSPPGGITPAQAREISDYGAARGVDVVPGTNLLSHMEGWFRLERYSGFTDGAMRSYPVLTRKEVWPLVRRYLDELSAAFPSKNFHAGLDELLFTGTNPEAAEAIRRKGKPAYFADFASRVVEHLQKKHGKTVWMWDDMVLGKNIHRPEGFNEDYRQALDRIPRDVVMAHWYYWTDSDGKHRPIIERVAASGQPFVVAPSSNAYTDDFGSLRCALDNQRYMARCGAKHGAFGLVNTHWESRFGSVYAAGWPLQALAAGFAWSGGRAPDSAFWQALSFTLTGDQGALVEYCRLMDAVQDRLAQCGINRRMVRSVLYMDGPHVLWRRYTSGLTPADRGAVRRMLARAARAHDAIGPRDAELKRAVRVGISLFEEALNVMDAFDAAWGQYHRAAELERQPRAAREFARRIGETIACLERAATAVDRHRRVILDMEKRTGHTPYDAYALGQWAGALRGVAPLLRAVVRDGSGLPYFEKLLHLPRCYHESNLPQLLVQNTFDPWYGDRATPPPTRWVRKPKR